MLPLHLASQCLTTIRILPLSRSLSFVERQGGGAAGHCAHLPHRGNKTGAYRGGLFGWQGSFRSPWVPVVADAQVSLGHADGQVVEPQPGIFGDAFLGLGRIIYPVRAVDVAGDRFNLFLDGHIQRVEEAEVHRFLRRGDDRLRQGQGSFSALLTCCSPIARLPAPPARPRPCNRSQFGRGVGADPVDATPQARHSGSNGNVSQRFSSPARRR